MKKIVLLAMVLSISTTVMAAEQKTYTEKFVEKHTQGAVNKEKDLQNKQKNLDAQKTAKQKELEAKQKAQRDAIEKQKKANQDAAKKQQQNYATKKNQLNTEKNNIKKILTTP